MRLLGKLVTELDEADVARLLDTGQTESVTLEYKRDLPTGQTEDRKEFLADVSAMANTQGGVILFGIDEQRDASGRPTGIPVAPVYGTKTTNFDATKAQLLQRIQGGLNPELPNCVSAVIPVSGETVVALGIPRSLYAPHAVWLDKSGKFYRRNDHGKYQVATSELRRMFLEADTWEREAEDFRESRVQRILAGYLAQKQNLRRWCSVVYHILPLGRLNATANIFEPDWLQMLLSVRHFVQAPSNYRPNFDGLYIDSNEQTFCVNFTQVLRCGGMEHYSDGFARMEAPQKIAFNLFSLTEWLDKTGKATAREMQRRWSIDAPYVVFLTILSIGGKQLYDSMEFGVSGMSGATIPQPDLYFPGLIVTAEALSKPAPFKPITDMLWQAAGSTETPKLR